MTSRFAARRHGSNSRATGKLLQRHREIPENQREFWQIKYESRPVSADWAGFAERILPSRQNLPSDRESDRGVQALLFTRCPRGSEEDDAPAEEATADLKGTWNTTKPDESRASMRKRCVS